MTRAMNLGIIEVPGNELECDIQNSNQRGTEADPGILETSIKGARERRRLWRIIRDGKRTRDETRIEIRDRGE